jgi:protocatechuate 3,4-dioxygenase, beta subunit
METPGNNLPRRNWLKLTFGLAAGSAGTALTLTKPNKEPCSLTPRQELGPVGTMKFRNQADHDADLTQMTGQIGIATGNVIVVHGGALDTDCKPIASALVEIRQANYHGKYRHEFNDSGKLDPNFQGWGRRR